MEEKTHVSAHMKIRQVLSWDVKVESNDSRIDKR